MQDLWNLNEDIVETFYTLRKSIENLSQQLNELERTVLKRLFDRPGQMKGMGQLLTVEDVSKKLSIPKSSVYKKVESGELPCVKLGRKIRFSESEVEEYLRRCKRNHSLLTRRK